MPAHYDVIIAGGGVAGVAAAAAMAQLQYRVLIVEPGLDHRKRLAGELIHPPGVADLRSLGLLEALQDAGAVPVHGFAVFAGGSDVLRYDEVPGLAGSGLAIEHGAMAVALLNAVEKIPHVSIWKGARVTSVDPGQAGDATVKISRDGVETELRTSLVIAADGRNSHVRRASGIADRQTHISNMVGFLLTETSLPHPGFGHVFADGPTPVLAYGVSANETRIMFDVPAASEDLADYIPSLPQPLRSDAEKAIGTQAPLRSANYRIVPDGVVKGRLVCVGDAGGCCHPVTATGLSACARDAVLLRNALQETNRDIPGALERYAILRETPQRTRMVGADALYEVLKGTTPEMGLLRRGLLSYWKHSPRGRGATMALLSTHQSRSSAVVREYLQVCRYALPELARLNARRTAIVGLSRAVARVVGGVLKGSPNQM